MKVTTIIQARVGSTRLPRKVLLPILDKPMLWDVVQRTGQARLVDQVVVATTTNDSDQDIVSLCESEQWPYYRGNEEDLLDRYYQAALQYNADIIVRITSDCPLIDPGLIDEVIDCFLVEQPRVDYVSNTLPPRTFPRGLDTAVFSFAALERAWLEDTNPAWREHVTPYIYRNPEKFQLKGISNAVDHSGMRWTVDTEEDMRFVRKVFEYFGHGDFSWRDVLQVLGDHEEWLKINNHVSQKVVP